MPVTVFGPPAAVSMLNRAFNDISPSFAIYSNQLNVAGTTPESIHSFANAFGNNFASLSNSALAHLVLNNMGLLPNAELLVNLVAYFAANPSARGLVVLQIGQILAEQEFATGTMAPYATAAVAWNNEVTSAHAFSIDPANVGGFSTIDLPPFFAKVPAESALADAIKANGKATTSANTLVGAAALQAQAKTLADATDAVALAAAGQTAASMAAAADDAALASATKAFSGALNDARVQVAYFKLAADMAVVLADRFLIAAANTLSSTLDDRDAVALMAKAILQLEAANTVRAKVEAIAAGAAPAQAAYEAHAPALALESPIVLVGSADAPVSHLLYIQ